MRVTRPSRDLRHVEDRDLADVDVAVGAARAREQLDYELVAGALDALDLDVAQLDDRRYLFAQEADDGRAAAVDRLAGPLGVVLPDDVLAPHLGHGLELTGVPERVAASNQVDYLGRRVLIGRGHRSSIAAWDDQGRDSRWGSRWGHRGVRADRHTRAARALRRHPLPARVASRRQGSERPQRGGPRPDRGTRAPRLVRLLRQRLSRHARCLQRARAPCRQPARQLRGCVQGLRSARPVRPRGRRVARQPHRLPAQRPAPGRRGRATDVLGDGRHGLRLGAGGLARASRRPGRPAARRAATATAWCPTGSRTSHRIWPGSCSRALSTSARSCWAWPSASPACVRATPIT